MATCLAIVAIICVLIATVATIVAFSTPNWLEFVPQGDASLILCGCQSCDCGLWLSCTGGSLSETGSLDNCKWYFADEFFIEKQLPGNYYIVPYKLLGCSIIHPV